MSFLLSQPSSAAPTSEQLNDLHRSAAPVLITGAQGYNDRQHQDQQVANGNESADRDETTQRGEGVRHQTPPGGRGAGCLTSGLASVPASGDPLPPEV